MGNMQGIYQQAKEQAEHMLRAAAFSYEQTRANTNQEFMARLPQEEQDMIGLPNLMARAQMAQSMALVGILGHLDHVGMNGQGDQESDGADKIVSAIRSAQFASVRESSMEFYFMEKNMKRQARARKVRRLRQKIGHKIAGGSQINPNANDQADRG